MKILVQDRASERFLAEEGWTAGTEDAKDFSDSITAIHHCLEKKLTDVRILFLFGEGSLNWYLEPFGGAKWVSAGQKDSERE